MAPWQPGQPWELLGGQWVTVDAAWRGGRHVSRLQPFHVAVGCCEPHTLLPTLPRLCPRAPPGCGHQELVTEPLEARPQHLTRVPQRNELWSPQCRAWGQDSTRTDLSLRLAKPTHPTLDFCICNQRVSEQLFVELETIAVPFPAENVGLIEMPTCTLFFPSVQKMHIEQLHSFAGFSPNRKQLSDEVVMLAASSRTSRDTGRLGLLLQAPNISRLNPKAAERPWDNEALPVLGPGAGWGGRPPGAARPGDTGNTHYYDESTHAIPEADKSQNL